MKALEINVVVVEPFAVAGEHQEKGKKVALTPEEARIVVGSGKADFATEDDRDKCYHRSEMGEPGVRTKVQEGRSPVTEHVTEERIPIVHVNATESASDYAKRKREDGQAPAPKSSELPAKKAK